MKNIYFLETKGKHKVLIVSILSVLFVMACGTSDISKAYTADNANRLLSKDQSKVWNLEARLENGTDVYTDCVENRTLSFVSSVTGDSLYILGRPVICEASDMVDTLYKADYKVLGDFNSEFTDSLFLDNEKHQSIEYIFVHKLTSQQLEISYTEGNALIEERYLF
jgi:hypothetical protein